MTGDIRTRIEQRLRASGLRLTPQRYAVLEFLARADHHPTAEEIGASVNRRFPRASRATVYNTVNALCRAGLVHEVYFQDGRARYDANIDPHHHFVCRVCGAVEDVPREAASLPLRPRSFGGRRIEAYDVVMRGICARCARSRT